MLVLDAICIPLLGVDNKLNVTVTNVLQEDRRAAWSGPHDTAIAG